MRNVTGISFHLYLPIVAMITISVSNYTEVSQEIYDNILSSIEFHQLFCSCGNRACLFRHAYYFRAIETDLGKERIRICRLKCSVCGKTHAILLSSMVPYSQHCLADQVTIIKNGSPTQKSSDPAQENSGPVQKSSVSRHGISIIMENNPEIDENDIFYIQKQYKKHWEKRLPIPFIQQFSLHDIVQICFSLFGSQFMQIKPTINLLYQKPHNFT